MAYPQSPCLTGGDHALLQSQCAQRSDIRGSGSFSLLQKLHPHSYHPPKDWKPAPWFAVPFNKKQLAPYDAGRRSGQLS